MSWLAVRTFQRGLAPSDLLGEFVPTGTVSDWKQEVSPSEYQNN